MATTVVWVEGQDFDETVFDTQKLSVIRGACRALEEMPPLVRASLERAFPGKVTVVAIGSSKAGLVVAADEAAVRAVLQPVLDRLATQGDDPDAVSDRLDRLHPDEFGAPVYAALAEAAPFAHLIFRHVILAAASDGEADVAAAIEAAQARLRLAQLEEPGAPLVFLLAPRR
jgi:hypothetical protein